jgi:hypothetical protein
LFASSGPGDTDIADARIKNLKPTISAMINLIMLRTVKPFLHPNDRAQNFKKIAKLLSGSCLENKHKLLGIIRIIERLNSYVEGNAKCRHLKKMTYKGTLRQVFICLRAKTPYTTPLHTVYVHTVYLFTQGGVKGGGELNQREGEKGNRIQSWVENTNITDCISSQLTMINTCCPASQVKRRPKCDRIAPSHPLSWPCVSDLLTSDLKGES